MTPTPKRLPAPPTPTNAVLQPDFTQAPASIESEMALLGAVLVNPDVYHAVALKVAARDFYYTKHGHIWSAMQGLAERKQPIDTLTVAEELDNQHQLEAVGGIGYLAQILNSTPSSTHAEFYAEIVQRVAVRRALLMAADEAKAIARDESIDLETVWTRTDAVYAPIRARVSQQFGLTMSEGVQAVLDLVDARARNVNMNLIALGYEIGLDDVLGGGFERGKFHVFGARSEHGKTAVLMNIALTAARRGYSVVYFTTEIPRDDLMLDFMAMQAELPSQAVRNGVLNLDQLQQLTAAGALLSTAALTLVDARQMDCRAIYAYCKQLASQPEGLDMVALDYLQDVYVAPDSKEAGNLYAKVSYVAHALERMSRPNALNVAMMVGAQVNISVEGQKDKRPHKSQLEGSNQIERKADTITMIYRHGAAEKDSPNPTHIEFSIQKNRQSSRYGLITRRLNPKTRRLEKLRADTSEEPST